MLETTLEVLSLHRDVRITNSLLHVILEIDFGTALYFVTKAIQREVKSAGTTVLEPIWTKVRNFQIAFCGSLVSDSFRFFGHSHTPHSQKDGSSVTSQPKSRFAGSLEPIFVSRNFERRYRHRRVLPHH